ncbi:uncharacterized protein LOC133038239 [Cannabis sativa]|uniref:uncharacterized protein LOC133038239 n=1 Tax=Cannabis sativa TaxID=3483 RepID=UPI0029C9C7EF|nr:uncharacterized protein LOC133038239 [Cannabis sativa]
MASQLKSLVRIGCLTQGISLFTMIPIHLRILCLILLGRIDTDVNKLNHFFDESTISFVLNVPIYHINRDCLIWRHDPLGSLTLSSAYHLANPNNPNPNTSNVDALKPWWKSFWSSNIPPKIRHFIWNAFNHLLPSKLNLFFRKILDNPYCSIYLNQIDSNTHSLLHCSRAGKFWKQSRFSSFFYNNKYGDIKEFLLRGYDEFNKDDLAVFFDILWAICNKRNNFLSADNKFTGLDVEPSIITYLQKYKSAQTKITSSPTNT